MSDHVISTILRSAFIFNEGIGRGGVVVAGRAVTPAQKGLKGFISGRVVEDGTPVVRKVFCYKRATGELVAWTVSNSSGDYMLDSIPDDAYYLVAIDTFSDSKQYNAVVEDLITPQIP